MLTPDDAHSLTDRQAVDGYTRDVFAERTATNAAERAGYEHDSTLIAEELISRGRADLLAAANDAIRQRSTRVEPRPSPPMTPPKSWLFGQTLEEFDDE